MLSLRNVSARHLLRPPARDLLPSYIDALSRGWSPSTTEDVSGAQLAEIAADTDGFLHRLTREDGWTQTFEDGTSKTWLPQRVFWIWDGAICGSINFRYVAGTEDLPPHVSGHIGYSVVPWKQRQGIGTRALSLILAEPRALGMAGVIVTCDPDNDGSRKVIVANGGIEQEAGVGPLGEPKRVFRIAL